MIIPALTPAEAAARHEQAAMAAQDKGHHIAAALYRLAAQRQRDAAKTRKDPA